MKHSINKLNELIHNSSKILILSHDFPDPDAVTSSIGMQHYIQSKFPGIQVDMKIKNYSSSNFSFIPNHEDISPLDSFKDEVKNYDLIIFVDAQETKRFQEDLTQEDLEGLKIACIDHHPYESCGYDFEYVDTDYISCADLIFEVLFNREIQNTNIAFALFMGLLADSGGVMFIKKSKIKSLANLTSFIDKYDFDIEIGKNLLAEMSLEEFMLYKQFINNVQFEEKLMLACSYVDYSVLDKYTRQQVKKVTSKFLQNIGKSIKNYTWAISLTPYSSQKYGISFRSTKGSVNVSKLAENFNGGGHIFTAGGEVIFDKPTSGAEAIKVIVDKISKLDLVYT